MADTGTAGHPARWRPRVGQVIGRVLFGVPLPALGTARSVLRAGEVAGAFPEGTRGRGDVAQVTQGATWLAPHSGAQIVPVACLGTRATGRAKNALPRLRSHLVVVFGEPFSLETPAGMPGRDRLRAGSGQLRSRLAAHVLAASERTGHALPSDAPLADED